MTNPKTLLQLRAFFCGAGLALLTAAVLPVAPYLGVSAAVCIGLMIVVSLADRY